MALIKTIGPDGYLVAINGYSAVERQALEEIVDAVNIASAGSSVFTDGSTITGDGTEEDPLVAAVPDATLVFGTPTASVAAQVSNHIDVTFQLKDGNGADLATKAAVKVWVSLAQAGDVCTSGDKPGALAVSPIISDDDYNTSGVSYTLLTATDGSLNVRVQGSAGSWYINLCVGTRLVSAQVTLV